MDSPVHRDIPGSVLPRATADSADHLVTQAFVASLATAVFVARGIRVSADYQATVDFRVGADIPVIPHHPC